MCGCPRTPNVNKQDGGRLIRFRCRSKFESQLVVCVSHTEGISCPPDLHLFYAGCRMCLEADCDSLFDCCLCAFNDYTWLSQFLVESVRTSGDLELVQYQFNKIQC